MRLGLSQAQEQAPTRSASGSIPAPAAAPTTKEIPYDYVARFVLTGVRGNRVQDVVNISIEGAFVAVTIGYSFIPASARISAHSPPSNNRKIDFKYSIVDSGTGRELQNRPIHNIAGLGEPNGERPFRALAKPMLFMPRSTIRFEVEEITEDGITDGCRIIHRAARLQNAWIRNGMTMNVNHACDIPRDTGYSNVCQICGVPLDAGYFDVASIKTAPLVGDEVELARYELNPQYCGTLLYFMQYAELISNSEASALEYARVRMADPLQQPAAGSLSAHERNIESLGTYRPSNPLAIGRGMYREVCGQKSNAAGE